MSNMQRRYFLQEQLKIIKKELGLEVKRRTLIAFSVEICDGFTDAER